VWIGSPFLDDGISIEQRVTPLEWTFENKTGVVKVEGKDKCDVGKLKWAKVKNLGVTEKPKWSRWMARRSRTLSTV
jgi:hypothetical protein